MLKEETQETPQEESKTRTTSISDRCDRCNAEAYVWVNGLAGDIYFCGHHFAKYESKIRDYAFEVVDDREFINKKPTGSAY
jgi:hypothetical protein